MKLRQVLFTGVLTTVVAVMLLTLVLPQTAEAGPRFLPLMQCISGCGEGAIYPVENETRAQVKSGYCAAGGWVCEISRDGGYRWHPLCKSANCR